LILVHETGYADNGEKGGTRKVMAQAAREGQKGRKRREGVWEQASKRHTSETASTS